MTNLTNVLNYKCRSLSNCGTKKTVVGNLGVFFWGGETIHGSHMHGVLGTMGCTIYRGITQCMVYENE